MKFVTLALFLLLGVATLASAQQNACCAPEQWEGEASGIDRERSLRFFEYLSYDFTNQMLRVDFYADVKQKYYQGTLIERYDMGKSYLIDENGNCKSEALSGYLKEVCVPNGYQNSVQFTLGGELACTAYIYEDFQNISDFTVATDGCIPINGQFLQRSPHNATWEGEVTYWDITTGIRNPNVFNVPSKCR